MKFYRSTVKYEEIYYDLRKSVGKKCFDLNSKYWDSNGEIHVIVSQITNKCMEFICAVNDSLIKDRVVIDKMKAYVSDLEESCFKEYKISDLKEITLNTFYDLLDEFSIVTLIEDIEVIKETIGVINGSFLYNEKLIDIDGTKKSDVHGYFFDKDEKKRIRIGRKIDSPIIAPIHYVIYEDEEEIRDSICNELIKYLWNQGRICNRRMVLINDADTLLNVLRKKVYNLNSLDGGVVILKLNSEADDAKKYFELISEDKNSTYSDKFTIIILANTKDVQGYNKAIKESFYSMAFYQIVNNRLNIKMAKKYFEEMINDDRLDVKTDEWKALFVEKEYTYFEVGKMYRKWLRNSYYLEQQFAQYKDVVNNYFEEIEDNDINARDELKALIGLEPVKNLISEIIDYNKLRKIRNEMNLVDSASSMHMVFTGNPGTAKTTVARLVARILKEEGILTKGDLIEVGRANLVDKYVGWTAKNIKEYFQKARGSVLFIDEAYSLYDTQNSFGDEAINTIVQEMENCKDEVVVIMAGYKTEMSNFLNKNSGMRSRIKFHVDFPDYSDNEMYMILEYLAHKEKMVIDPGAKEVFCRLITRANYINGNGRSVRNIYEKAKMKQAKRLLTMKNTEMVKEINHIKEEDFYGI